MPIPGVHYCESCWAGLHHPHDHGCPEAPAIGGPGLIPTVPDFQLIEDGDRVWFWPETEAASEWLVVHTDPTGACWGMPAELTHYQARGLTMRAWRDGFTFERLRGP